MAGDESPSRIMSHITLPGNRRNQGRTLEMRDGECWEPAEPQFSFLAHTRVRVCDLIRQDLSPPTV